MCSDTYLNNLHLFDEREIWENKKCEETTKVEKESIIVESQIRARTISAVKYITIHPRVWIKMYIRKRSV